MGRNQIIVPTPNPPPTSRRKSLDPLGSPLHNQIPMRWNFSLENIPWVVWDRATGPLIGVAKLLPLPFPKLEMGLIPAIRLGIQMSYG